MENTMASRMRFAMHLQSSSWEGYLGRQFTDAVHAVNTLDELGYQVRRAPGTDDGTVTPWDTELSFTSPDALAEHFAAMEGVKVIHPGGWTFAGIPIAEDATVNVTEAGASAAYWMADAVLEQMRADGTLKDVLEAETPDQAEMRVNGDLTSGVKARVTTHESARAEPFPGHVHLGRARVLIGDDKGGFTELQGGPDATFDPEQVQTMADRVQAARGRIAEAHGKDVAELLVDGGHDPFLGDPADAAAPRVTWRVGEPFCSPSFPRRRLVADRREAIQYALKLVAAGAEGVTIHDAKLTTEFRVVDDELEAETKGESRLDRERRRIEQLRRTLNDECDCPGCTARRQREADGKRFIKRGAAGWPIGGGLREKAGEPLTINLDGAAWPFDLKPGGAIYVDGKMGPKTAEALQRAVASPDWRERLAASIYIDSLDDKPSWWERLKDRHADGWESFKDRWQEPLTVGDMAIWGAMFIVVNGIVRALT